MDITWLGHSCFRLRGREIALITDPYASHDGIALGKVSADVVTVSHDHRGHNFVEGVDGGPRVVAGPGEYEIKGGFITGVRTYHDVEKGTRRGKNTAYVIEIDDLVICHLGDIGHVLTSDQVDQMSNVDVLLVPVGGGPTITSTQVAEIISLLEPKIVVPMHFRELAADTDLDPLEKFLREMSVPNGEPRAKLSLSKSALPDATEFAVLEAKRVG